MTKIKKELDYDSFSVYVNTKDYPDFCDSYIEEGQYMDGTFLTEEEIEELNEDSSLVYDLCLKQLGID